MHAPSALNRERLFEVREWLFRFASGFSGHFASLVVSKKVPPTYEVFDFFFFKLKLEYFPIKKVFRKTAKYGILSFFKLIMSEVSKDLRNIFFYTPDFES